MKRIALNKKFYLKSLEENELGDIIALIQELAKFEKLEDQVSVNEETLRKSIFQENRVSAYLIKEEPNINIGYIFFFYTFSSFKGKAGMYIEDIYIRADKRSQGIGTALMEALILQAKVEGLARIDWQCIEWNVDAMRFYERIGAYDTEVWRNYRINLDD